MKVFKKGEVLLKEGEKAGTVYFIQSGSVSVHLTRQKGNVEIVTLGNSQILGEHALSGAPTHPYSAVAQAETKVIEIPSDSVKAQIEASPQLMKLLSKSLSDKLKIVMNELKSVKMERDPSPCPPEQTAKIFGTVFHAARSKGEAQKDGTLKVPWPLMKQYAQRIFLESPKRLENAVNVCVKLGLAKFEMVKNEEDPEAPDELGFVHFSDLSAVEQFFEFYQYYFFKGGKSELLKTDERTIQMVQALVEIGSGQPVDRFGAVRLDYTKVVEAFKEKLGFPLNSDHFAVMEQKGVFVKRHANDKGVELQFEFKEFERTVKIWKILREVERWNEKGHVDPNEPVFESKKASHGPECPSCHHSIEGAPKFCPECGTKLAIAA
jgi:rubrerythrin